MWNLKWHLSTQMHPRNLFLKKDKCYLSSVTAKVKELYSMLRCIPYLFVFGITLLSSSLTQWREPVKLLDFHIYNNS